MNKPKFEVGDRVRVVDVYDDADDIINKTGTIRVICEGEAVCHIEFDENIGGHDIGGLCKWGYGWACLTEMLEKI